jgi:hypothetical protein
MPLERAVYLRAHLFQEHSRNRMPDQEAGRCERQRCFSRDVRPEGCPTTTMFPGLREWLFSVRTARSAYKVDRRPSVQQER